MDAKKVGVHFASGLTLIVTLALVYLTQGVKAQSGSCPDWTSVIVPSPQGNYPGTMSVCADSSLSSRVEVINDPDVPCTSGLKVDSWDPTNQGQPKVYLVPPTSQTFPSGNSRLRWQMSADRWAISDYDIQVTIKAYNADNHEIGTKTVAMKAFPHVTNNIGDQFYTMEITIRMVQNGYLTVQVTNPVGPFYIYDAFYYGFKLLDQNHWPPVDYCYVQGGPVPTLTLTPSPTATGTPEPTNTPNPSATPTGTPPDSPTPSHTPTASNTPTNTPTPQSYPTSAGGTPSPFPTRTPNSVPTVPQPNTPTRLSVVSFPTVNFPGVNVPTFSAPSIAEIGTSEPFDMELTPNATLQADQTRIANLNIQSQAVISSWYTATNYAAGVFSLTVTNTTGLSNVVEIAGVMGESIVLPFSYARGIREYVPNLWPLILFLILGTGWILFNLVLKWVIPMLTFIFDVIKKLPFA